MKLCQWIQSYWWAKSRKTKLQCVSNGVTFFLHLPIDVIKFYFGNLVLNDSWSVSLILRGMSSLISSFVDTYAFTYNSLISLSKTLHLVLYLPDFHIWNYNQILFYSLSIDKEVKLLDNKNFQNWFHGVNLKPYKKTQSTITQLQSLELLTAKTPLLHILYYMNWLTHDFWTRTGGWEFDHSHGPGTSSPSHWQQVEEQAPKPVGWMMCFLLMTFVPVQKLCVNKYICICSSIWVLFSLVYQLCLALWW